MFRIETQHKRIPRRWIALMVLLALPMAVVGGIGGNLTFTMRKFLDSPALINALSSLDVLFNIMVGAVCLYVSDYIWTKRGRRIPFILVSWLGMALCLLFIPIANSAWSLVSLLILWLVFQDVSATLSILVMEIVPPNQRLWYSAWTQWAVNIFNLLMFLMVNGRFDDTLRVGEATVGGERAIYSLGAIALLAGFVFVFFFIRERKPETIAALPKGGAFRGVIASLFKEKALWPVYLLAFSGVLITTGLGAIDGLLITEQWGYSKQEMATNVFVGGLLNIALLPLIGWGLNHISRINGFLIGVLGTLLLKCAYYVFVQYILPDNRPELSHLILFGYPISLASTILTIVTAPLIFDYIPRNRMGTAQAGLSLVRNVTRMITLNGVGLWVVWASKFSGAQGYDYFTGYQFMIVMELIGCVFLGYFILQVRRGKVKPLGREGFEDSDREGAPR